MKLTITDAKNYDSTMAGKPIIDSKGRKKYRSVIKTVEKGEELLSGFVYNPIKTGEVIEAEVTTETYNGKSRLKFDIKNTNAGAQANSDTLAELRNHTVLLKQISNALEAVSMAISTHQTIEAIKKPLPSAEDEYFGEIPSAEPEAMSTEGEDDFGGGF